MILKPGDKRIIRDFEDLVDIIKESTSIDLNETAGQKSSRIKKLLANYEAFCLYYFPEYCFAPMATFHKNIQKNVYEKPNNIFLEQLARGFAKSTHFGLFLPLFIKFNNKLNGMLVGSSTESLAAERLADIQVNLEHNKRIINDFGEQMSWGNWEDGKFKTRDDVGFYAFGKGQSPRGTRFKWKRPNYASVDDLNDFKQLKNPAIANEDKRWVLEELKPALWTRTWWLVVAQNKFNDNSVTALIEEDPEIKKIVHRVDVVNAKGKSNWPENPDFSDENIKTLKETEGAAFIRERMNTPFEEGTTFKVEWLNNWIDPSEQQYDGYLIHYLDPSYKSTDKSDYKAWILLGKTGKYYDIIKPWIRKTTSLDMWQHAFEIDNEFDRFTINHSMEANFIQDQVHEKELFRVEEDEGRNLRVQFDRRQKGDKFERIQTMQPLFQRGLIRFNVHEKETVDMKLLRSQLLAIEKGSRINDDGPDALEGAIWMADRFAPRKGGAARTGKYNNNSQRRM